MGYSYPTTLSPCDGSQGVEAACLNRQRARPYCGKYRHLKGVPPLCDQGAEYQYTRSRKATTRCRVMRFPSWAFFARWSPERLSTSRSSPEMIMLA